MGWQYLGQVDGKMWLDSNIACVTGGHAIGCLQLQILILAVFSRFLRVTPPNFPFHNL